MSIIDSNRDSAVAKILGSALLPVRQLLPSGLIEERCRKLEHPWRNRVFSPVVTLLMSVWKHSQPALVSVRAVEDFAASLSGAQKCSARDGKGFCEARARLPEAVFQWAAEHVGNLSHQTSALVHRGLRVILADGTTVRTANTKALEECFGRSRNAVRESRSPLMRLVVLVCAGCGAVMQTASGAYAVSEQSLFMTMLAQLSPNLLLIGDGGYASFVLLGQVRQRHSHFLVRVSSLMLKSSSRKLGYREDLREWRKPKPSQTVFSHLLGTLPEAMEVRVIERSVRRAGYRTWTLRIATSLTDAAAHPADELVELYLGRWRIETALRTLKTHGHLAHLTGKTPDVARKEIHCSVLAHNCICALQAQSGEAPALLSHKRAREITQAYAGHMAYAPTTMLPGMFKQMLRMIATALQLPQQRGPEPRAIIQRPSTFPVLMTSRADWKVRERRRA